MKLPGLLAPNEKPASKARGDWRPAAALFVCLVLVAGFTYGLTSHPREAGQSPEAAPSTRTEPLKAPAPPSYPISGYFISASSRDSANKQKLSNIKAAGGDTVVTFGVSLTPTTLDSLPTDCVDDGINCAKAAAGSLKVERYFTYLDGSNWDKSVIRCPADRQIKSNGQSYTVLVLPSQGGGCTSSDGKYNIVVAGGGSTTDADPSHSLATAATDLGMRFYAGMPAPVKRTDFSYLPDMSYTHTLLLFTQRFLQYHASTNNVAGLAGFYHHTEMPLTDSNTFDSILELYTSQNREIHRILPSRQALVSPYIDARVDTTGISLAQAKIGARRIAQTSTGIVLNIAIQDGMGTGKGGAFGNNEAGSPVDPYAASIVGNGTWGTKYRAPNRDYFAAAASGLVGTSGVLWANVEGMAPATKSNPCGDSLRGQTSKSRIDRQLQQVATAKKVISFMWDAYYTCIGTGTPLKSQLEEGRTTPIITDANYSPSTGQIQITGFNIRGGKVLVAWTDASGRTQKKSFPTSGENPDYGKQKGMNSLLEMTAITLEPRAVNGRKNISLQVTNGWGAESTEFLTQSK